MALSRLAAIHRERRTRGNPYAFIEDIEEAAIYTADRKILENPHAHSEWVEEARGATSALEQLQAEGPQGTRVDSDVERLVSKMQRAMWRDREKLFGRKDVDPIELLNPEVGLRYVGFGLGEVGALGNFSDSRGVFEVAGLLDRRAKKVSISTTARPSARKFTIAHELGHVVLHKALAMHRDRPIDGSMPEHDLIERQANKFAIAYLMPVKLLTEHFVARFGAAPFTLNEASSFALFGLKPPRFKSLRELCRIVATTTRFNGLHFVSMADQFRVSRETLAIRLEELHLVGF